MELNLNLDNVKELQKILPILIKGMKKNNELDMYFWITSRHIKTLLATEGNAITPVNLLESEEKAIRRMAKAHGVEHELSTEEIMVFIYSLIKNDSDKIEELKKNYADILKSYQNIIIVKLKRSDNMKCKKCGGELEYIEREVSYRNSKYKITKQEGSNVLVEYVSDDEGDYDYDSCWFECSKCGEEILPNDLDLNMTIHHHDWGTTPPVKTPSNSVAQDDDFLDEILDIIGTL